MSKRIKIVVYQKASNKPILLHSNIIQSREVIVNEFLECMKSDTVQNLKTDNDNLIIRPSEIAAVLISTEGCSEEEKPGDNKKNFYKEKLKEKEEKPSEDIKC